MSTQRRELAALAAQIDHEINDLYSPGDDVMGEDLAELLYASGYRKPRTITTTEELDALPRDSVVLGFGLGERTPYLRAISARGVITWGCVGSTDCHDSAHLLLDGTKVTVLFEPSA